MRMASAGRKIVISVASLAVICVLCGGIVACSNENSKSNESVSASTKEEAPETDDEQVTEDADDNLPQQNAEITPQSRVDTFVNAFNAVSETAYVQDVAFDPSDKDAPYRPHRYTSPIYKDGKGSHGNCGSLSVKIIGCKSSTEVEAIASERDYQSIASFARSAIYAARPEADRSSVDAAIDKFVNSESHQLDFMSIDSGFQGSATGKDVFLRFK